MRLQTPFNAQAISPDQGSGFRQMPLGKYPVEIVSGEVKANSANTGGMLQFTVNILAGEHQGQQGNFSLNLYHPEDQTRSIAEGSLSAICHASGRFLIEDTDQLNGAQFAVNVTEQRLTKKQEAEKAEGKNVTPFVNVRILNVDGSEIKGGGGQPQQQAAQQQPQGNQAGGWNQGGQQQQPNNAPANTGNTGWNQGGQQQPQQQQPAQQQPAGNTGWSQGGAQGGPSWAKK
jgi:hypothetical protein